MDDGALLDPVSAMTLRRAARDVRMRLLFRLSALHAVGGLIVFSYLQQVYPASEAFRTPWLNDFALLVITEAVLAPVAWTWVGWHFQHTGRWALDGRLPDVDERRQVLEEPWRMAVRPFVLWLVAASAISTGIAIRGTYSAAQIADLAQIMIIGGIAVSAVSYLVLEQTYRPLFRFALAGEAPPRPASLGLRPRLILAWAASSGIPLLGVTLAPLRETGKAPGTMAALALIGLIVGLFTMSVAANSIAAPLDELRRGLGRVGLGDLTSDLDVDDGGDVGQVQAGFNRMVTGLRERAELADLFGRHVGQEVAAQALERGAALGGESRAASMVFVDLIGSTAMAEVLPPGEVVATLNAFFHAVVETVQAEGGWVNKFEGDGALCLFGVPGVQPDHAARALRAGASAARATPVHRIGASRPRRRHRRLVRHRGGRQRRRRGALRVHGHRPSGERGRPPLRPGQAAQRPGAGIGVCHTRRGARGRPLVRSRSGGPAGPAEAHGDLRAVDHGQNTRLNTWCAVSGA